MYDFLSISVREADAGAELLQKLQAAAERWPELFVDACVYKVIPRENFEQGFPVAVIYCESRDMLFGSVAARAGFREQQSQRAIAPHQRGIFPPGGRHASRVASRSTLEPKVQSRVARMFH